MRKQYHLRPAAEGVSGLDAWDVDRLIALSAELPVIVVRIDDLPDVDRLHWFLPGQPPPTPRVVAEHVRLVERADLTFPILLGPGNRVLDGMHRVVKALNLGRSEIQARRFPALPPPDHTGVDPGQLPYDEGRTAM